MLDRQPNDGRSFQPQGYFKINLLPDSLLNSCLWFYGRNPMPVITIQFIKDVVATPEQKRQLIVEMTNTFVGILGDVVRPFVYCIIQETPQQEWGIAGVPMPDLVYLT